MWRIKKTRQAIDLLRQATDTARLSDLEKQAAKNLLAQFMQTHPVRAGASTRQLWQIRGRKAFPTFFLLLTKKYMLATIAVILVMALSGGVTYAAEGALPGDALYPIKVKVNEEVRAAFAISTEAEADWNVRRAERRLEEAAILAATGELDNETRVRLEERFAAHAERIKARVDKLEEQGKEEQAERVAERLAVSLQVHERILDEIVAAAAASDRVEVEFAVKPLVRKIRAERRANESARAAIEARLEAKAEIEEADEDQDDEDRARATTTVIVKTEAAAAGRREACENKLGEAERFIGRADLSADARVQVEARLHEARALLDKGNAQLGAVNADAFILFGECHRAAQEAKTLAQAHAQLRAHLPAGFKLEIQFEDDDENEEAGDEDKNQDEDEDDATVVDVGVEIDGELKQNRGQSERRGLLRL